MTGRLHLVRDCEPSLGEPVCRATSVREGPSVEGSGGLLLDGPTVFLSEEPYPVRAPGMQGLAAHLRCYGALPGDTAEQRERLQLAVAEADLRGRGGGHFPVSTKWRSYLRAGGGGVVVANAAESEPLSRKDAALLQLRPHLLLDGMAITRAALGACETVLWLHESAEAARQAVAGAVAERAAAGMVDPGIRVVTTNSHYLSGESSAIVRSLSGGVALPEFRRKPASAAGVRGLPTLVHNVETLCRIALLARGFAARSALFTIAFDARRTVLEAPPDEPIAALLTRAGVTDHIKAVLLGGYGGRWLDESKLDSLTAHESSARRVGASLGAGVLLAQPARECGLATAAEIARFMADSSARQCGPCLFGLKAVADVLEQLVSGRGRRRDPATIAGFIREISGRGACHHPDGAVRMVASALDVFAEDVTSHLRAGRCAQG